MSEAMAPLVRLFGPEELPVRIPDWPEGVGIAMCRVNGKTIALQPYHTTEKGHSLRQRLPKEAGDNLRGFAVYPALKGLQEAKIGYSEDQRILSELENALRSMPKLIEAAQDFAINYEYAAEEGLGLDGLSDSTRRGNEGAAVAAQKALTEQLPVGYVPFVKADSISEVIAGAVLRPIGAQGIDLVLSPDAPPAGRDGPPEVQVLVRDDSLRIAVPLAPVLQNSRMPPVMRLPAGSLVLGQTNGKPVPAVVLRRGNFLFVAPDHSAIAQPAGVVRNAVTSGPMPWKAIGLGVGGVVVAAALVAASLMFWPAPQATVAPSAPVEKLRTNLFAPSAD